MNAMRATHSRSLRRRVRRHRFAPAGFAFAPPTGTGPAVPKKDRRGVVLIAVLIVTVLLSLAAYQYTDLMTAEYKASSNAVRYAQARAAAESGIIYVATLLADPNMATMVNGNPFDNATVFQNQPVAPNDTQRFSSVFSVVSPRDDDAFNALGPRWGVTDEASKININALIMADPTGNMLFNMLMKLPNMTSDIANAIVDWVDADDTVRQSTDGGQGGAESDYYMSLTPPYKCKNGPIDSIEELLMVRGVTPQLLFGDDINRNGYQDANENATDGTFNPGWAQYLTMYGREPNKASDGTARIFLNMDTTTTDLPTQFDNLTNAIGNDMAVFIMLYRIKGPYNGGGGGGGGGGGNNAKAPVQAAISEFDPSTLNLSTAKAGTQISSIYDLFDAQVEVAASNPKDPSTIYTSPLTTGGSNVRDLLPLLLDKTTTSQDTELLGRINVNTATQTILQCLPTLSDTDIQMIMSVRPQFSGMEAPDAIFLTPAWLITEANFSPARMKTLEKYVTSYTQVYRFQVLGYFESGTGPVVRIEAVVDTNNGRPRILYQRDISELGKGFDLPIQQN
jgi:type II secretory pathway component PulK